MRSPLRWVVLGLVLLAAVALAASRVRDAVLAPGPAAQAQKLSVAPGATLRGVLQQLHAQGLLEHPRLFELYLRCCHASGNALPPSVRKGRYLIEPGSTPLAILQQLVEGRVILEQFTIVEGWTFAQLREALQAQQPVQHTLTALNDAELMRALGYGDEFPEGRFAPDTYRFAEETTDREILQMAHEAQARILAKAWQSRTPDLPLASPDQALALASIVERESALASERPRIAGVYLNRLRMGMRLQSDPSVIYGIRDHYDGTIHTRDLRTDTPYNTYTRAGLPPTPIAMPGHEAIWATVHPELTDALYFVAIADGTGGHYFSATLAEHNKAVQRYLTRLRRSEGR